MHAILKVKMAVVQTVVVMLAHGLGRHVMHLVPTVKILLWHWFCHSPWHLANPSLQAGSGTCRDILEVCIVVRRLRRLLRSRYSLIDCCDRLIVAECICWLKKMGMSAVSPKKMVLSDSWESATGLLLNCMHSEGLGTSSWYFMEGVCVMTVSPDSCCQAVETLMSGPPYLTVSKKSSNRQWYCGEMHPVCWFNTR